MSELRSDQTRQSYSREPPKRVLDFACCNAFFVPHPFTFHRFSIQRAARVEVLARGWRPLPPRIEYFPPTTQSSTGLKNNPSVLVSASVTRTATTRSLPADDPPAAEEFHEGVLGTEHSTDGHSFASALHRRRAVTRANLSAVVRAPSPAPHKHRHLLT